MHLIFFVKPQTGFFALLGIDFNECKDSKRRNIQSQFSEFLKTSPCVVWAEVSESGLGIKIGPRQQKL